MTKVQKVHSLTGRITPALVYDAWRAVRRNRGAAGIDKVSIQMFQANLDQNLDRLMRELKTGAFEPLPARRVYIPKSPGKFRPLGIPAVRDRVAQEVLRQLLSPIFERRFHDDSYGFRPGRSCHQAVERVLELRRQGYDHVLDADISGFFDNLSHRAVMAELSAVIADGNILRLVVLRKIPQGRCPGRGQVPGDASRHAARRSRFAAAGEHRPQPARLASSRTWLPLRAVRR